MAVITVPLADRSHSGITQLLLNAPELLLEDGRILRFLSRLTTLCSDGRCAWELVFTSMPTPTGTTLDARLITHASVPAALRPALNELAAATQERLLNALQQCGVSAAATDAPLPLLRSRDFLALTKQDARLISPEAMLIPGQLRQRLCSQPGNGFSLLLVQSDWGENELAQHAAGQSPERQAMLARDPVFDFTVTLWGPDAQANAAWLQGLTLDGLAPATPLSPAVYPACLRHDPWQLMKLLPQSSPRTTLLTLSELLTLCGCPAEPGEMQRMCRMSWREEAAQSLQEADLPLLAADMTLQDEDLRYMGLTQDSDLENVLQMDADLCDMLRMCVSILRRLGAMQPDGASDPAEADRAARLTGMLLPTVGHIYEQFVRACCYRTMHCPYFAYVSGRRPFPVSKVLLNAYDVGPDARFFRPGILPVNATDNERYAFIREKMTADFTAYATVKGQPQSDPWWYALFKDMSNARYHRNGLTHEKANLDSAARFARTFLREGEADPSLLRRLLMCRSIQTAFPAPDPQ